MSPAADWLLMKCLQACLRQTQWDSNQTLTSATAELRVREVTFALLMWGHAPSPQDLWTALGSVLYRHDNGTHVFYLWKTESVLFGVRTVFYWAVNINETCLQQVLFKRLSSLTVDILSLVSVSWAPVSAAWSCPPVFVSLSLCVCLSCPGFGLFW